MKRAGVVAAAAALSLAGCGGSSLSASELRSQATRVCNSARTQTNRIPTPTSPATGAAFISRGLAVLQAELSVLRRLQPPRDLGQVYSTAVGAFQQEVATLQSTSRDLKAGRDPITSIRALQGQLAPLESQGDGAWRALEIPACLNR
jgi:hypothetical protein